MTSGDQRERVVNVGVIGTGFIARNFMLELERRRDYRLAAVLTRRPLDSLGDLPGHDRLTNEVDRLIERSDIVFECTGDVAWAMHTVPRALDAGRPVLTMNTEFHVTVGSAFADRGLLTEAEGDQPGSLAALHEEVVTMGFAPLVYANMKGFLNTNPTLDEMRYWGAKQNYSLSLVTSATDGTKMQFEQCIVGNFLGADIVRDGLLGSVTDDIEAATQELGEAATAHGRPIVDYVLSGKMPHGVFIVARHHADQATALVNYKMGAGPFYRLLRPAVLVHLEAFKTLERLRAGGGVLLNNSRRPRLSVAAVAKRDLPAGTVIKDGIGSFDVRGICVRIADHPDHVPIGLVRDAHVRRPVPAGALVQLDDLDLPHEALLATWRDIKPVSFE